MDHHLLCLQLGSPVVPRRHLGPLTGPLISAQNVFSTLKTQDRDLEFPFEGTKDLLNDQGKSPETTSYELLEYRNYNPDYSRHSSSSIRSSSEYRIISAEIQERSKRPRIKEEVQDLLDEILQAPRSAKRAQSLPKTRRPKHRQKARNEQTIENVADDSGDDGDISDILGSYLKNRFHSKENSISETEEDELVGDNVYVDLPRADDFLNQDSDQSASEPETLAGLLSTIPEQHESKEELDLAELFDANVERNRIKAAKSRRPFQAANCLKLQRGEFRSRSFLSTADATTDIGYDSLRELPSNQNNIRQPQPVQEACCADPRGTWSSWRPVSQCTHQCGGFGRQMRRRFCLSTEHGCPCIGNSDELVACNLRPCQYDSGSSSCAPGLAVEFRNNIPLCVAPSATSLNSPTVNSYIPYSNGRSNAIDPHVAQFQPFSDISQGHMLQLGSQNSAPQRIRPGIEEEFTGRLNPYPELQHDEVRGKFREENTNSNERDYSYDDVMSNGKSEAQIPEEQTSFNVPFEDNTNFVEEIDENYKEGGKNSEAYDGINNAIPVGLQFSDIGANRPKIKLDSNSSQAWYEDAENLADIKLDNKTFFALEQRNLTIFRENNRRRHKRQQPRSTLNVASQQTSEQIANRNDLERFQQLQKQQVNGVYSAGAPSDQIATSSAIVPYPDVFGTSSNAKSVQNVPTTSYPFTVSGTRPQQNIGPGPLQVQSNIIGVQTASVANADRLGQAALVGIHPGQLEWKEESQARGRAATIGRGVPAATRVPITFSDGTNSIQRDGIDSAGQSGSSTSLSNANTQTYFLGVAAQSRTFTNRRNGRVTSIVPGYLIVQSTGTESTARILGLRQPTLTRVILPQVRAQTSTTDTNLDPQSQTQAQYITNTAASGSALQPPPLELSPTEPIISNNIQSGNNQQTLGFSGIDPVNIFPSTDSSVSALNSYAFSNPNNVQRNALYSPDPTQLYGNNFQSEYSQNPSIQGNEPVYYGNQAPELGQDIIEGDTENTGTSDGIDDEAFQFSPVIPPQLLSNQDDASHDGSFNLARPTIPSSRVDEYGTASYGFNLTAESDRVKRQQPLLSSLQRQFQDNGLRGQAGYQTQVRFPAQNFATGGLVGLQQQLQNRRIAQQLLLQDRLKQALQQTVAGNGAALTLQQGENTFVDRDNSVGPVDSEKPQNQPQTDYIGPGLSSYVKSEYQKSKGIHDNQTVEIRALNTNENENSLLKDHRNIEHQNQENYTRLTQDNETMDTPGFGFLPKIRFDEPEKNEEHKISDVQTVPESISGNTHAELKTSNEIPPLTSSSDNSPSSSRTSRTQPSITDDRPLITDNFYGQRTSGQVANQQPINNDRPQQQVQRATNANPTISNQQRLSIRENNPQSIRQQQNIILSSIYARAAAAANAASSAGFTPTGNTGISGSNIAQGANTRNNNANSAQTTLANYLRLFNTLQPQATGAGLNALSHSSLQSSSQPFGAIQSVPTGLLGPFGQPSSFGVPQSQIRNNPPSQNQSPNGNNQNTINALLAQQYQALLSANNPQQPATFPIPPGLAVKSSTTSQQPATNPQQQQFITQQLQSARQQQTQPSQQQQINNPAITNRIPQPQVNPAQQQIPSIIQVRPGVFQYMLNGGTVQPQTTPVIFQPQSGGTSNVAQTLSNDPRLNGIQLPPGYAIVQQPSVASTANIFQQQFPSQSVPSQQQPIYIIQQPGPNGIPYGFSNQPQIYVIPTVNQPSNNGPQTQSLQQPTVQIPTGQQQPYPQPTPNFYSYMASGQNQRVTNSAPSISSYVGYMGMGYGTPGAMPIGPLTLNTQLMSSNNNPRPQNSRLREPTIQTIDPIPPILPETQPIKSGDNIPPILPQGQTQSLKVQPTRPQRPQQRVIGTFGLNGALVRQNVVAALQGHERGYVPQHRKDARVQTPLHYQNKLKFATAVLVPSHLKHAVAV
ncbi:hemicentin-1 [Ditylenchus destructor]|nr:hemicentin-1 [Ditylenchus destructor]